MYIVVGKRAQVFGNERCSGEFSEPYHLEKGDNKVSVGEPAEQSFARIQIESPRTICVCMCVYLSLSIYIYIHT